MGVETKDSGKRIEFETGARRDVDDGKMVWSRVPLPMQETLYAIVTGEDTHIKPDRTKPGIDLLTVDPDDAEYAVEKELIPQYVLDRLGTLLARGARKYGDHNWKKGIPLSRFYDSAERHLKQARAGATDEDHASAVLFNMMGVIWTEWAILNGLVPAEIGDAGWMKPAETVADVGELTAAKAFYAMILQLLENANVTDAQQSDTPSVSG